MRKQQADIEQQDNPFSLSIGDLMAALLLIFVLLLASTLLRLQEEFENKAKVAERYSEVKEALYLKLLDEFGDDLEEWNADLDPHNLSIRFKEPDILFAKSKSEVKDEFKKVLNDFFPRYIRVLSLPQFINSVEEVRIEGHTDSDGPTRGTNRDDDYFYNMALSQDRTRSVLAYALSTLEANDTTKGWVQERLTANGLSSSKPIISEKSGQEDKNASRRVEFRIRTNAEEQIQEILNYSQAD